MTRGGDILVVGGYGVVGRRIAARLAPALPGRVVIAGRSEQRAADACEELGADIRARRVDVTDPASIDAALAGVGTVMGCVAQRDHLLAAAAVDRGLAYTDIAPELAHWRAAAELAPRARQTGARILLGAGLVPGISNLLARWLATELGGVDRIESAVALGLGDEYGPDSVDYVLAAVFEPWTVVEAGAEREAVPFTEGATVAFPAPIGARTAYLYPWSDVAFYPTTLAAHTAVGRIALDPAWVGRAIAGLLGSRARRWLQRPGGTRTTRRAVDRLRRVYAGRDRFALVVTAARGERVARASVTGRHQADATAIGAAELCRMLAAGEITEPGVWLPEQVAEPAPMFAALAAGGYEIDLGGAALPQAAAARQEVHA